jgi:UDP-GlcNAc3NAcA epimerase
VFFDELQIRKPAYNLEVNSLGHGAMTGRMLEKLEATMLSERPQLVLVYGDTNSALAGALAAAKLTFPSLTSKLACDRSIVRCDALGFAY